MDTEKHIKLQKHLDLGHSPSDEGPYYHHTWWEAYKGGVKGKLGGLVIGASVGALAGAAVFALAAIVSGGTVGLGALGATMIAFSGAGLVYGAHEFGEVGKVTGAVSAGLQQAESRIKTAEGIEFAKIKQELSEIKSLVKGQPAQAQDTAQPAEAAPSAPPSDIAYDDQDYRKTHYAKLSAPDVNNFAFWKIAVIGLAVGAAAGLLLGGSGIAADLLKHAFGEAMEHNEVLQALSKNIVLASTAVFGALGASFGINRDLFRKIFDKTDLWFKGITHGKGHDLVREQQVESGSRIVEEIHAKHLSEPEKSPLVATAIFPDHEEPATTRYRDMVLARAERALQELNPSSMTRH